MRAAVISDVHGNLAALRSVQIDIEKSKADEVWCLGDVIGYGADPWECWRIVRQEMKAKLILGNHELALVDSDYLLNFHRGARSGVEYARKSATAELIREIKELPQNLEFDGYDVVLAHGAFSDPWIYILDEIDGRREFDSMSKNIGFIGHSHMPFFLSGPVGWIDVASGRLNVFPKNKYVINPGSVGQPRDGDCRASYGLFEFEGKRSYFTLRRVDYPVAETVSRMADAGLPNRMATRLFRGE